jgi:hypothetical protein
MLCVVELLSVLGRSHANSGDKPKGRSPDGGTDGWVSGEEWVESEDGFSRPWRDWGVLISLEFDETGGFFLFLDACNKGEWEGGRDRRRRDFLNGGLLGGRGDIWGMRWGPVRAG